MSFINKSKTVMINPILQSGKEELLIKSKYILKEDIEKEQSYYEYEKLKHNLKKKLREKLLDELASKIIENESQKNIHVIASLNTRSDSKGIYHRIKKINQTRTESHKLKGFFINWLYKTPGASRKRKISKNTKNDRFKKIKIRFYRYQNSLFSNISKKTTDMTSITSRTKIQIPINLKIWKKPKYKYNYSSNNSNVSYTKTPINDRIKSNIYIGKKNGEPNHIIKKYNNFGSLTVIQHNVDNTKKFRNYQNIYHSGNSLFGLKKSRNQNNKQNSQGIQTVRTNKSYHNFFYHTFTGRNIEENKDNNDLRN